MSQFNPSYPSPPEAPRLEILGPHFEKIFLNGRWEPLHLILDVDTGPPHCHNFRMKVRIVRGGYVETVWVPQADGGFLVIRGVKRLPGTTHEIDEATIHLVTDLPGGISISEALPEEARREWFFYDPRPDGSIWRSSNWNGPWEPWHPAGPVIEQEA